MGVTNADRNRPNFTNDYWILLRELGQMDDLSKQWIRSQMGIDAEVPYQKVIEILLEREMNETELKQFNKLQGVSKRGKKN
ncbi:hypothetical protein GCM10023184_14650 [Flaviaesturariibacter amylovorans]|uniref:Uncharacterized protein n=2 Tax=Flaviaesturariibacter amylovorans TaxID=1084520 RepID=A0ABP8GKP7_9BACT